MSHLLDGTISSTALRTIATCGDAAVQVGMASHVHVADFGRCNLCAGGRWRDASSLTTASDMLHELAAQDSDASLARRLRRFTGPQLLAIDEVGYLNCDNRYADLVFEVVTRRYLTSPVLITTNKPFSEWADVFFSAACVVTKRARASERNPRRPTHPSLRIATL